MTNNSDEKPQKPSGEFIMDVVAYECALREIDIWKRTLDVEAQMMGMDMEFRTIDKVVSNIPDMRDIYKDSESYRRELQAVSVHDTQESLRAMSKTCRKSVKTALGILKQAVTDQPKVHHQTT